MAEIAPNMQRHAEVCTVQVYFECFTVFWFETLKHEKPDTSVVDYICRRFTFAVAPWSPRD